MSLWGNSQYRIVADAVRLPAQLVPEMRIARLLLVSGRWRREIKLSVWQVSF